MIGTSANVQARKAFGGMTNPNTTNISFAWGFGFMFAVYLAASISGKTPTFKLLKNWLELASGFKKLFKVRVKT